MKRKIPEPTRGQAELAWPGGGASGDYEIAGDPSQLRGREHLRGTFTTTLELAALAFTARQCRMTIGSRTYRINTVAHTAGQPRVWFEILL